MKHLTVSSFHAPAWHERNIARDIGTRPLIQLAEAAAIGFEGGNGRKLAVRVVQQLADGVAVVCAEVGEVLLCGRAQEIMKHLILVGFAVTQVFHFAGQLKAHGVEENLARQIIRQKIIRALHLVPVHAHEILIEQRSLDHRHVRRHHIVFVLERIHQLQHLGPLAGERDDNYNVLAKLGYRVRQLAHAEPVEQVAAGKFITCEHRRRTNAQPLELRKYFVRAVTHTVQRDWTRFFLQSAPDRLLY